MANIYVPIPDYNIYSAIVHSAYILPLIIASALFATAIYHYVKHKKDKSRNKKISVWKGNYLSKIFEKDKQSLLQKSGNEFIHSLIIFTKKWLDTSGKDFDTTFKVITNDSKLIQLLITSYYTQKQIAKKDEITIKELINKLKPLNQKHTTNHIIK